MRTPALMVLFLVPAAALAGPFDTTPGPVSPAGVRAVVDLPASEHMKNTGGSDGLGLCVFTSIQHSARWQGLYELEGFRAYMEVRPGGGYPKKVDQTLAAFCASRNIQVPLYIQHTGGDEAFLDLCLKTGRCPGVTYAGADGYYSGGIDHMVNLNHLDPSVASIVDNNRVRSWVWMSRSDFLSRWRARGGGWAFVFLAPPPPPYPFPPAAALGRACGCDPCRCDDCQCAPRLFGQCINGNCPIVRPSPSPSPATSEPDGWVLMDFSNAPPMWKLYQRGRMVGAWGEDGWHPSSDGVGWSPAASGQPPIEPPGSAKQKAPPAVAAGDVPTGVMADRIRDQPAYAINGVPVTKDDALNIMGGLTDDSANWNLTVVGDAAFCARVKTDVTALPAEARSKLHVQTYSPAVWQVPQLRLAPGVTLRRPSVGRVGAEVGTVPPADYTAAKLADLMTAPGGPTPKPIEPPPATPKPAPVLPVEVPSTPTCCLWCALLAAMFYWRLRQPAK